MVDEGSMVLVPKGTSLTVVEKINNHVSWAEIDHVLVIMGNVFIKCD
jgi:hypothetical protein